MEAVERPTVLVPPPPGEGQLGPGDYAPAPPPTAADDDWDAYDEEEEPLAVDRVLWDAIVVGGGPGGLTAASDLARSGRSVIVVHGGDSRTALITRSRNHMALPGVGGPALLDRCASQAAAHGALFLEGAALSLGRLESPRGPRGEADPPFLLTVRPGSMAHPIPGGNWSAPAVVGGGPEGGHGHGPALPPLPPAPSTIQLASLTVILATGVHDLRPSRPIPGMPRGVDPVAAKLLRISPVADSGELRGRRLGVLGSGDAAASVAIALRTYTQDVTVLTDGVPFPAQGGHALGLLRVASRGAGSVEGSSAGTGGSAASPVPGRVPMSATAAARLAALGIRVETAPIARLAIAAGAAPLDFAPPRRPSRPPPLPVPGAPRQAAGESAGAHDDALAARSGPQKESSRPAKAASTAEGPGASFTAPGAAVPPRFVVTFGPRPTRRGGQPLAPEDGLPAMPGDALAAASTVALPGSAGDVGGEQARFTLPPFPAPPAPSAGLAQPFPSREPQAPPPGPSQQALGSSTSEAAPGGLGGVTGDPQAVPPPTAGIPSCPAPTSGTPLCPAPIALDEVYSGLGCVPRSWLAAQAGAALASDGRIVVDRGPGAMATGVPGLFAAGDVASGSLSGMGVAMGEGSIAAAGAHAFLASRELGFGAGAEGEAGGLESFGYDPVALPIVPASEGGFAGGPAGQEPTPSPPPSSSDEGGPSTYGIGASST